MTIRSRGIRPLKPGALMVIVEEYGACCRWFMTWRRDKEIDKHTLFCIVAFLLLLQLPFCQRGFFSFSHQKLGLNCGLWFAISPCLRWATPIDLPHCITAFTTWQFNKVAVVTPAKPKWRRRQFFMYSRGQKKSRIFYNWRKILDNVRWKPGPLCRLRICLGRVG